MKIIPFQPVWELTYYDARKLEITDPAMLKEKNLKWIPAKVPGNVELDLSAAGILPKDLFLGENIRKAQICETCDFWYHAFFPAPVQKAGESLFLCFHGVDCFAAYWLNDILIGTSDNALIAHSFAVTPYLQEQNELFIKLSSPVLEANRFRYQIQSAMGSWQPNPAGIAVRKPPHCYGWDIMPRAVSAGLWRKVELQIQEAFEVRQLFAYVLKQTAKKAVIRFAYELEIPKEAVGEELQIRVSGCCGDSYFEKESTTDFKIGEIEVEIPDPALWYPAGYGEPNLYQVTFTVSLGTQRVCSRELSVGVRTVELSRTTTTDGKNGKFAFRINGTEVFCRGTNWVSLDAYHSRDAQRYERALELCRESNCNLIRCWGGNVYEEDVFFDYCDKHGMMVWQDFAMACGPYPQDEPFVTQIGEEAQQVIRRLRNHPSLILWSGDNECDQLQFCRGFTREHNKLTRQVLAEAVRNNDYGRPYLPSSPLVTDTITWDNADSLPENHLWGPRDYYKSTYYTGSKAHFVSEIGYHGCAGKASIKKFIEPEFLWPYHQNPQWNLHSSDQQNRPDRILLMEKQVRQLFGTVPEELDEYVLASQISQAEAKKFFIESMRAKKPVKSGVIWWNLLDGWPQLSDAVVDYYFEKKLAFYYIKQSQQPFCLMAEELENWGTWITAVNDTLSPQNGTYQVQDVDTEEILLEGEFKVGPNEVEQLGKIPVFYSEQRLFLIRWQSSGHTGFNHYISGTPAFSLKQYKKWLIQIIEESGADYRC